MSYPSFMLHPANRDPRSNADRLRKCANVRRRSERSESPELLGWDKKVCGETIRLALLLRIEAVDSFNEEQSLSMFQQVSDLMKKAKPKLVVALVTKT